MNELIKAARKITPESVCFVLRKRKHFLTNLGLSFSGIIYTLCNIVWSMLHEIKREREREKEREREREREREAANKWRVLTPC